MAEVVLARLDGGLTLVSVLTERGQHHYELRAGDDLVAEVDTIAEMEQVLSEYRGSAH